MADSIYVAMNAAAARAHDLEVVADNLANVDTPGFKSTQTVFESFLPPMREGDRNEQVHVVALDVGVDGRAGPAVQTDSPLDVRVSDGAWLAVELPSGATGYTRDGRLSVDAEGLLRAGNHPVLGQDLRPIRVEAGADVTIGDDGNVNVGGTAVATLGRFTLDGTLSRVLPSVVQAAGANSVDAHVESGMREGSNVNALSSVVRLVQAQRAYDEAMQAVSTARRLDEKSAEIGRVR